MRARVIMFLINTVLLWGLILYLWFSYLPLFLDTSIYDAMRSIITIVSICLAAAYVTSSVVILGKV
jgi:hypothetical protein